MSEKLNQSLSDEHSVDKDNSLEEDSSLELDEDDIALTGYKKSKEASNYSIEMTMANLLFETLDSTTDSEEKNKDSKHRKKKNKKNK
jgi:hypothetical protein